MKMTSLTMSRLLKDRLIHPDYHTEYNRENGTFRVEWKNSKQGVTIKLSNIISKYSIRGEEAIDELIEHIDESLKIMNQSYQLEGKEKNIFPVIRSTSFPTKSNAGLELVWKDHTAETRIFYALDLGKSYRLIDYSMLEKEGWEKNRIDEIASFNLRSLENDYKLDTVADNDFYFFAKQDGYDASRILNEALLEEMKANSKGDLAVATPHQDVLIIADIQNKTGYDILAQMTMQFFTEGRIPITSLPFIFEDKKLTPIFILAKNRPEK
ncbi:DUF1444 domain-containing protein [Ornithinibacillus bavariensis]|uniref:UPF0354 protein J43TS3_34370 n=1 Tax=Ornithinibacillus bavariensis TaxID=545502 RepID=A0A920C7C0_9BACI|nr:DUF1444 domain-containing protein [Ornithinibacillus bavariensis]GIO28826.1 UPF0354 protein YtpQ [Ornithinibacillus bavariensis]